jgi:hypothetical protein
MLDWDQKLLAPGRRMKDCTPMMIDNRVAWTVELWIPVNGVMTAHHPTIDNKITMEELNLQLERFAQS